MFRDLVEGEPMLPLARARSFVLAAFAGSQLACANAQRAPVSVADVSLPPAQPRPAFEYKPTVSSPSAPSGKGGEAFEAQSFEAQSAPGSADSLRTASTASQSIAGSFLASKALSGAAFTPLAAPPSIPPIGAKSAGDRIEIEAQFAIRVTNVDASAAAVRSLVAAHGGTITRESRVKGAQSTGDLTARIPTPRFEEFAAALERAAGEVVNRNVKIADVALEERDLAIIVANLEAALGRYRELFAKATEPRDTLAIERELDRVTTDLERVKGRLSLLRDRVANATVAIRLQTSGPERSDQDYWERPQFSLGGRGLAFVDTGATGTLGYLGGGLTARLPSAGGSNSRGLVVDVDAFQACCGGSPKRNDVGYAISLGWEMYPPSFGRKIRSWLVPYGGIRAGYANMRDRGDFAAAAVLGLDLLRTTPVVISLDARLWVMVGNPDGPHAGVQPNLGAYVGF